MQTGLVARINEPFGVYEIVDGKPHWRKERFAEYVRRNRMWWPAYPDGTLDERESTFRQMEGQYPHIGPLRELRCSLSALRLNELEVGLDGRNRTPLWAYGTKTGRNAPSNSKYLFGPAKWIRFLVTPAPGRALVHRDYCQQEVRIAAVLSGDAALLEACESGDVYLGIAQALGFVDSSISIASMDVDAAAGLASVRALFKIVVLGIQYGLGAKSLAIMTGLSLFEAGEIIARLRAQFRTFEMFTRSVADHAGLNLEITTALGWYMRTPPGTNPRTIRNFPVQATAAEIMHVACVLAERRGIEIVAPIHDAFLVEAPADQIEDAAVALDRIMRDAAAVVLRGYELPTDFKIIRPGERYFEKRGVEMWNTVNDLLAQTEQEELECDRQ
jgi:hypothetical protein